MKILDRYLAAVFLRIWFSVNLVLAGLLSFLELAVQLDDVGKGSYNSSDAVLYVALTLPDRMMDLAPPSALLGSIITLGLLSKNLELLAMLASGISIQRVGWALAKPALLTLLALLLGAQFVIPSLEQTAWTLRETALSESGTILPRGDFWTRSGRRFINLRTSREHGAQAADIYEFDEGNRLTRYIHARETKIGPQGEWVLRGVREDTITDQGVAVREIPQLAIPGLLTSKEAVQLVLPPQSLSLTELARIIGNQEKRGENPGRYRLALWQKLSLPVMTGAMIMISLPFVCRSTRGSGLGWLIVVGAVIGVAFFFLNQILGYAGLILQIPPAWTTLVPALAVLAGGVFLTRRIP